MKLFFLCAALCLSMLAFSQEKKQEEETNKNEVKINAALSLAGYPEFSFERILSEESSVGVSIGFSLSDDNLYNFLVLPYYRFYFGEKRAAGFFIEGNTAFYSQESINGSDEFGLGVGVSIGGKLITKSKKWTGELLFGIGRNFVNDGLIDEAYPRFGISIGRRF